MMNDFWDGFEKKAFLAQATRGILSAGAKGIGAAARTAASSWGGGAKLMPTVKTMGSQMLSHAKPMAQAVGGDLRALGQRAGQAVKSRFNQPTPPPTM